MQSLLLLTATTFFMRLAKANGFNRYAIGNTGCSIYFFTDPGAFTATLTPGGDVMYFNEYNADEACYGSVTVALEQPVEHISEAETMVAQLMKTVGDTNYIKHTAGLTLGLIPKDQKEVRGILDYWQDDEGRDWKVKGWTDGRFLCVLYVKNIGATESQKHDVFLDGSGFHKRLKYFFKRIMLVKYQPNKRLTSIEE